MPEHRRRRATRRSATTPIGPKGRGGMAPFPALPLLGDGATSSSSRRLESGAMAHATGDTGGPGRASRPRSRTRRYVEQPDASKRHRLQHIAGRSREVVRYAGESSSSDLPRSVSDLARRTGLHLRERAHQEDRPPRVAHRRKHTTPNYESHRVPFAEAKRHSGCDL